MVKVAVTEHEHRKAEQVFSGSVEDGLECLCMPANETALAEAIRTRQVSHVIVGVEAYSGSLYEALPAGGVIARFGVGHDGVNKPLATERSLLCTNTPGVLDDSVAEHAVNLLLAAARHTATLAASMKAGQWSPALGSELKGKTLAIIGCGAIGQRVARRAAVGLGMKVIGCEKQDVDVARMQREFGFTTVINSFEQAVAQADFVSFHIPSLPETYHFLDRKRLALLPARCWLVNTARGALVDEIALFDALAGGTIAGAALDVYEREPYEPAMTEKDLRKLNNVIMTPHVGSSTREACERMARRALQNIRLAEAGRYEEMDLLNPDVLPAIQKLRRTTS